MQNNYIPMLLFFTLCPPFIYMTLCQEGPTPTTDNRAVRQAR